MPAVFTEMKPLVVVTAPGTPAVDVNATPLIGSNVPSDAHSCAVSVAEPYVVTRQDSETFVTRKLYTGCGTIIIAMPLPPAIALRAVTPIVVASKLPPGDVVVSTNAYVAPIESGKGVREVDRVGETDAGIVGVPETEDVVVLESVPDGVSDSETPPAVPDSDGVSDCVGESDGVEESDSVPDNEAPPAVPVTELVFVPDSVLDGVGESDADAVPDGVNVGDIDAVVVSEGDVPKVAEDVTVGDVDRVSVCEVVRERVVVPDAVLDVVGLTDGVVVTDGVTDSDDPADGVCVPDGVGDGDGWTIPAKRNPH